MALMVEWGRHLIKYWPHTCYNTTEEMLSLFLCVKGLLSVCFLFVSISYLRLKLLKSQLVCIELMFCFRLLTKISRFFSSKFRDWDTFFLALFATFPKTRNALYSTSSQAAQIFLHLKSLNSKFFVFFTN